MPQATAVTIGNFDGVHLGHAALIASAREEVGHAGRVVVIAFDPHPLTVLAGRRAPLPLTTFDCRARLLRQAGADEVIRLEPTARLLSLPPEQFLGMVVERFRPAVFVEGDDFRFGRDRSGDIALLEAAGQRLGFRVRTLGAVEVELTDQTIVRASSTLARWLLARGRVEDLARVLGRFFRLEGPVKPGDHRGRTMGFPTANLVIDTALPADGVYAARARLSGDVCMLAAVNIGMRPTVGGRRRLVEACLLTEEGKAADLPVGGYGWSLELDLIAWLRDQVRFPGLASLAAQVHRDCQRVRTLYPLLSGESLA